MRTSLIVNLEHIWDTCVTAFYIVAFWGSIPITIACRGTNQLVILILYLFPFSSDEYLVELMILF